MWSLKMSRCPHSKKGHHHPTNHLFDWILRIFNLQVTLLSGSHLHSTSKGTILIQNEPFLDELAPRVTPSGPKVTKVTPWGPKVSKVTPSGPGSRPRPRSRLTLKAKIARLVTQYRDIFSNISEGTDFLLQGVTDQYFGRQ